MVMAGSEQQSGTTDPRKTPLAGQDEPVGGCPDEGDWEWNKEFGVWIGYSNTGGHAVVYGNSLMPYDMWMAIQ
jgi:hypothetical protein